jgi:tetratricopeptide (TPR) repeat protein
MTESAAQPIIGRDAELAQLRKSFDEAMSGRGGGLVIRGEAGMGKSRLAAQLATWGREAGSAVCIATCSPSEATEPYAPLKKAFAVLGVGEFQEMGSFSAFDDVFLISGNGLLLSHLSNTEKEGMDEEILSSMLTAVQDFVRDSFGDGRGEGGDGGLGKLEYGNKKIMLAHGRSAYAAAVMSGEEHPRMRPDLAESLKSLEEGMGEVLASWNGDMDEVSGAADYLKPLMARRYPVKPSIESMNVEAERLKVHERMAEALAARAGAGAVIIIDEAQWADGTTLAALPYLMRNASSAKVLICCTTDGTGTVDGESSDGDSFAALVKDGVAVEIPLRALGMAGVVEMASASLGCDGLPEGLAEYLFSVGGGNPLFTSEALAAVRSSGALSYVDGIWVFDASKSGAVPMTVADILSGQIERLGVDELHALEFAAVLGAAFDPRVIGAGASMDDERLRRALESLRAAGMVDDSPDGGMRFRHGVVQEAVYGEMSARWRRAMHRSAGETLESMNRGNVGAVLYKLAYHFARTNEYSKGIEYSLEAGDTAAGSHAPREAARFYGDADKLMAASGVDHPRKMEIRLAMISAHDLVGEYDKALAVARGTLAMSPDAGTRARVEKAMGQILHSKGDYDGALASYKEAARLAAEAKDDLLLAASYGGMGKVYLKKGEMDRALEIQSTYLAAAERTGIEREIGQAHMNIGGVYYHKSDYPKAMEHWGKCLAHMMAANDEQGIAYAYNNLGVVYETTGQLDKAIECYVKCLDLKKKIGDVRGIAMTHNNIGLVQIQEGDFEAAIESYKMSLEIRHRIGDRSGIAYAFLNLGMCHFDLGKHEVAVEYYNKQLAAFTELMDDWGAAMAKANLAEAELALGRTAEAMAHCEAALAKSREKGFKDVTAPALRTMGSILAKSGRWDEARARYGESLEIAVSNKAVVTAAKTRYEMGMALAAMGEKGLAKTELEAALKTFESSKMAPLAQKVREALSGLG